MKKNHTNVSIILFLIILSIVTYSAYIFLLVNKINHGDCVSKNTDITETFTKNLTVNSNNTIIVTTTIPNDKISEKRRNNLFINFSKWNIPLVFNDYIKKKLPIHQISYEMVVNNLNLFKNTNFKYAIICDDDFCPIDTFLEDLNKTVDLLPNDWRCLHLCPGYLWGRTFKDMEKIGRLNPENNVDDLHYHVSGRFFSNCDSKTYYNKQIWLGGPVAVLVNQDSVDSFITDFISQYKKSLSDNSLSNTPSPHNNDVIMTEILTKDDFICREPMLGYEKEEGGTTFS